MLKTLNVLLVAAMLGAASYTYKIKHEAEELEQQVAKIDHKIALEKETIALLDADWTLLNQPSRLQRLATIYEDELQLKPMRPDQIVASDELPAEPVVIPVPQRRESVVKFAYQSEADIR